MITVIYSMILRYVRIFLSFFADSSPFKKRGFSTHTRSGDLCVSKDYGFLRLYFYQSISDFNPVFHEILNFTIPDGVFVLEFKKGQVPNLIQDTQIYYAFENVIQVENYWFLFDKRLDFGSEKLPSKLEAIEEYMERYKETTHL